MQSHRERERKHRQEKRMTRWRKGHSYPIVKDRCDTAIAIGSTINVVSDGRCMWHNESQNIIFSFVIFVHKRLHEDSFSLFFLHQIRLTYLLVLVRKILSPGYIKWSIPSTFEQYSRLPGSRDCMPCMPLLHSVRAFARDRSCSGHVLLCTFCPTGPVICVCFVCACVCVTGVLYISMS